MAAVSPCKGTEVTHSLTAHGVFSLFELNELFNYTVYNLKKIAGRLSLGVQAGPLDSQPGPPSWTYSGCYLPCGYTQLINLLLYITQSHN